MVSKSLNIVFITILIFCFSLITGFFQQEIGYTQSIPNTITLDMYQLTFPSGGNTEIPCTSDNSTSFGCVASAEYTYPYESSTIAIPFEEVYLVHTILHEMGVDAPREAYKVQSVASRSFAANRNPTNNSNQFQVFLPRKLDSLNQPHLLDRDAPCQDENLSNEQTVFCQIMADMEGLYLSHGNSTDAIDAEFRQQNGNPTNPCPDGLGNCPPPEENCPGLSNWSWMPEEYPYLRGVSDPISYLESRSQDDCNSVGMSHWGTKRWLLGVTCLDNSSFPECGDWSVTWTNYQQILFHYYTDVHLRNADDNNARLSPNYRWNLLDVTWEPDGCPNIFEQGGTCTGYFWIQNTGTETWLQNQFGFSYYQWQQVYAQQTTPTSLQAQSVIPNDIVPGDNITLTLTLPAPPGEIGNRFDTKLEMGQIVNDNWTGFSQLEAGYSWRPYKITTCINTCRANLAIILINSGTGKVTPPAPTPTPAATHTPSRTPTPSSTFTNTPTATPSHTPTPSSTFTHTPTTSPSATSTQTATVIPSATDTATQTQIPGPTRTPYPTRTPVGTAIFATATLCTSTSQHDRGGENMCKPTPCSGSGRNCPDVAP